MGLSETVGNVKSQDLQDLRKTLSVFKVSCTRVRGKKTRVYGIRLNDSKEVPIVILNV